MPTSHRNGTMKASNGSMKASTPTGCDNLDLPKRKPLRLKGYDYNQDGSYFVTICVKNRNKILSDIVGDDANIVLKKCGLVIQKYIKNVSEIEKYVIMPDHIHMIIRIRNSESTRASTHTDIYKNKVSNIVRSLKILTTKEIGESIFQRSYYDHIIRDQNDYNEIWEYIDKNPKKYKHNDT